MELRIREKIYNFANVLMRVPPIFLLDELLRIGLGVPQESVTFNITESGYKVMDQQESSIESIISAAGNSVLTTQNSSDDYPSLSPYIFVHSYQMYLMITLRFLACCLACIGAICTFLLGTKHLGIVYLYLTSIGISFMSYWSNIKMAETVNSYINSEGNSSILAEILNFQFTKLMTNGPGLTILQNYVVQSFLAYVFLYVYLGPRNTRLENIILWSFTIPCHVALFPLPANWISLVPLFTVYIPLLALKFTLVHNFSQIWNFINMRYILARTFFHNYGLSALAEAQWMRLHVPNVLRTFWILRVAEQVFQMLYSNDDEDALNYYTMIKTLMVNGCETLTALLGMTSIISVICHYIGSFFYWVLMIDSEDERSIGTVSAMLFYILALQTGLTSLDKENRLLRLCRNLCLLFTAVLHFVHNIVNPLLMSLSASHNPALHRHLRALAVCIFLIAFPTWLLIFLWSRYTISTWLLAVNVFSIEVVVKVLVSLAIYSLFLYDAWRKTFWDELDDWVYIIRSFGNTIEFAFGIILFFNGFWILVFEAGGAIRAFMMCVHAYFNLWCEAKAGWSVFMKRRLAVNKINSLPEASPEQLSELQDVCAICYSDMATAKITKCNHFFHGVCLRKWLYVQDRCPLCHDIMYKVNNQNENTPAEESREENIEEANNQGNDPQEGSAQPNQTIRLDYSMSRENSSLNTRRSVEDRSSR